MKEAGKGDGCLNLNVHKTELIYGILHVGRPGTGKQTVVTCVTDKP